MGGSCRRGLQAQAGATRGRARSHARGGAGRGCIPVTRANRAALRLLAQPAARMALRSFCSADGSDPLWVRWWAAGDGAGRPGTRETWGTLGRADPAAPPARALLCRRGDSPPGPRRSRRSHTLGTGFRESWVCAGRCLCALGFCHREGTPDLEAANWGFSDFCGGRISVYRAQTITEHRAGAQTLERDFPPLVLGFPTVCFTSRLLWLHVFCFFVFFLILFPFCLNAIREL